jgi:hypothetical protein
MGLGTFVDVVSRKQSIKQSVLHLRVFRTGTIAFLSFLVQEKTLRTPGICVIFLRHNCEEEHMLHYIVVAVCILFCSATSVYAEFYRWIDQEGKENFTNELKTIPPEYREGAEKVATDEARVSVGDKAAVRQAKKKSVGDHKDRYGRGEEYWRKKASTLRRKLQDQQDEHAAVEKQIADLEAKHQGTSGTKNKKRTGLEKKKEKLEKDIAKTKRSLEVDLPEEARKADAYPGWIRE